MEVFVKVIAAILITSILTLVLSKKGADISLLLTITVCCIVMSMSVSYIQPILDFAYHLIELGGLDVSLLQVILKTVGIGLISQIATLVCVDSGNQSLGKAVQIMTTAVILSISIPVLEQMLSLIEVLLGEV